jgi:Flp pilus assembly protein TadD
MRRIFKVRSYLAVSTTVVLCGLNQIAAAQTQISSAEGKIQPEQFVIRQHLAARSEQESATADQRSTAHRNDAVAAFEIGISHESSGHYREAIESMRRALEIDSTYVPAYNELGILYCRLSRYDEAAQAFEIAVSYEPHQAATVANLGTAYFLLGRYSDAAVLLRDAVNEEPNFEIARNNLGQTLLRTGQYEEAIECISRVIELGQGREAAPLYNDIGVAYSHLKRFQDAARYLREAIKSDANYALARYNLGLVSVRTADHNTAYEQYVALKSLDRNLADALYGKMFASKIVKGR